MYALACFGAAVFLIVFVVLLLLPALNSQRGAILKRTLLIVPGVVLFAALLGGRDAPPIHDISTDTLDPPAFVVAQTIRGDGANPLTIKPESIAAQIQAYPGLTTMRNAKPLALNFEKALKTADALGWEIYHRDPANGTIEAVDSTSIMNFKDDVAIRLRRSNSETLIDLRSVSRVGVGDIGANAKRIRAFQKQFNAL